jgi:flagellar basal body-associated protein FliL
MKQKDIMIIIAVAIFGVVVALLLSNMIFVKAETKAQTVEKIDAITAEFNDEEVKKYVNSQSVNPSQLVEIGKTTNDAPFQ